MQKNLNFLHDLQLSSGSGRLQTVYEEIHGLCRLTESFSNVLSIVFFSLKSCRGLQYPKNSPAGSDVCVEQIE